MSLAHLSDRTLNAFVHQVYQHTGITMDETKRTMLVGRLSRRARRLKLASLDEYLALLKRDTTERDAFVDAVTTNKTSMFRSARIWQHILQEWLPSRNARIGRPLHAWSAACSTGQEPASLALMLNHYASTSPQASWRVDASDISPQMVRTAEKQCFDADRTRSDAARAPGFDPLPHFEAQADGTLQLSANLRRSMRFYRHNLFDKPKSGPFDLILVRNVIIYFSSADKSRVIRTLVSNLREGGLLVVGESETLESDAFGLQSVAHCIYQKPSAS